MSYSIRHMELLEEIRDALNALVIERALVSGSLVVRDDSTGVYDDSMNDNARDWLKTYVEDLL